MTDFGGVTKTSSAIVLQTNWVAHSRRLIPATQQWSNQARAGVTDQSFLKLFLGRNLWRQVLAKNLNKMALAGFAAWIVLPSLAFIWIFVALHEVLNRFLLLLPACKCPQWVDIFLLLCFGLLFFFQRKCPQVILSLLSSFILLFCLLVISILHLSSLYFICKLLASLLLGLVRLLLYLIRGLIEVFLDFLFVLANMKVGLVDVIVTRALKSSILILWERNLLRETLLDEGMLLSLSISL